MITYWYMFQNFKVTTWPKEDYGKFFDGDSYIILNVSTEHVQTLELCVAVIL